MDRAQKQESIEALKCVFAGAGAVVVTHYTGMTVAEMTELRARLRKEDATFQVVKNTLVQKALGGSIGEAGDALFTGPVAIAFGKDPVSAAKIVTQYAKENDKLKLVGGILGQTTVLDETAVRALATLPSLDAPSNRPGRPGTSARDDTSSSSLVRSTASGSGGCRS